jgi:hypothetical protein
MQNRATLVIVHTKVDAAMNIKFARSFASFSLVEIHSYQVGSPIEPLQRSSRLGDQNAMVGKKNRHVAGVQRVEAELPGSWPTLTNSAPTIEKS